MRGTQNVQFLVNYLEGTNKNGYKMWISKMIKSNPFEKKPFA
jgi:hypothetical protein